MTSQNALRNNYFKKINFKKNNNKVKLLKTTQENNFIEQKSQIITKLEEN